MWNNWDGIRDACVLLAGGEEVEAGSSQVRSLISVYLPRADIRPFKFKRTKCFVVFVFLLLCNSQRHHGLLRRTAPCKADLFVLLRDLSAVSAGQCFSFVCLLSVQRRRPEINALLAAHCCTKAMIDPSAVTMAIRSQTPVSTSDGVLHCCFSLEFNTKTSQIPRWMDG